MNRALIDRDAIRIAKQTNADERGPTDERLRHTGGHFESSDAAYGNARVYTIQTAPLERMLKRKAIDEKAYKGLAKYRLHWNRAGLLSALSSMELDRVFASDAGGHSGMAKTEQQVFHRNRVREAVEEIGHKESIMVDNVVCNELELHIAGLSVGYKSPHRARMAAETALRESGARLARLWGL